MDLKYIYNITLFAVVFFFTKVTFVEIISLIKSVMHVCSMHQFQQHIYLRYLSSTPSKNQNLICYGR